MLVATVIPATLVVLPARAANNWYIVKLIEVLGPN
jgi:hypothetical protein